MRIAITFLGIVLIILSLTLGPLTESQETQRTCVNIPDAKRTIVYDGKVYRRIRTDTPIFYAEIAVHLAPTAPSELYVDESYYPSYVPWYDGMLDLKYVNWRPLEGVDRLLFVDKTATRTLRDSGFRYYDIYLKPDAANQYTVPSFIQTFCSLNFPISRRTIMPDEKGNIFPPGQFNTSDIPWEDGAGDSVSGSGIL